MWMYTLEIIFMRSMLLYQTTTASPPTDMCSTQPCHNHGTCYNEVSDPYYSCACRRVFNGTSCQDPIFFSFGNCKYHVDLHSRTTILAADNTCRGMNGSLAMPKSSMIQDELEKQVVTLYGASGKAEFWIGGVKDGGIWFWLDGTTIPMSGPNQKWVRPESTYMVLDAYRTTRNDMKWHSRDDGTRGLVCEVPEIDPCGTLNCTSGTVCKAVGCQANCVCPSGYGGPNCKTDLLLLATTKPKYFVREGENVTVTMNITSHAGPAKIDVYVTRSSIERVVGTKRNAQGLVDIMIGPLSNLIKEETYHFRGTPESDVGAYYRYTTVTFVEKKYGTCEYYVYEKEGPLTFDEANSFCIEKSAELAMMKSAEIQNLVEGIVQSQRVKSDSKISLWIGGYKMEHEWFWMDGTKIPITSGFQKWTSGDGERMVLSFDGTNFMWSSYATTALSQGYICEKSDDYDPCQSLHCFNGGKCIIVGCQSSCQCAPGYRGFDCRIELTLLTPVKNEVTVGQNQNATITLLVVSDDRLVRIDVQRGASSAIVYSKRNVSQGIVEFVVGPLGENVGSEVYHFKAVLEAKVGSYNKSATVTVIKEEALDVEKPAETVPEKHSPAVEKPAETPTEEHIPVVEKPVETSTEEHIPVVEKPVETPTEEHISVVEKPAETPTEEHIPVVEKPAETVPEEHNPDVEKPAETFTEEHNPVVEKPAETPTEEHIPVAEKPAETPTEEHNPVVEKPAETVTEEDSQVVAFPDTSVDTYSDDESMEEDVQKTLFTTEMIIAIVVGAVVTLCLIFLAQCLLRSCRKTNRPRRQSTHKLPYIADKNKGRELPQAPYIRNERQPIAREVIYSPKPIQRQEQVAEHPYSRMLSTFGKKEMMSTNT